MKRVMKYRIIAVLLVCCFLLAGCSNLEGSGTNGSADETELNIDTLFAIVKVTINPVFSLGLDENNSILEVNCENEDATQLFEELDVVNMSYEEGMSTILNKAYEMEYIQADTSEINIEVMLVGETDDTKVEEITDSLKKPMIEFQQVKELEMNITESEVEDGFVIEPLYYGGKALAGKGYYKDDVLVKVVKQYDNPYDDSRIYKLYNKHEDMVFWRWFDHYNWSDNYYDKNGTLRICITDFENGDRGETFYGPNGKKTYSTTISSDRVVHTYKYNEDEICILYTLDSTALENGVYAEWTYYPNGNPKTYITDFLDGAHSEDAYDENGNQISHVYDSPSGIHDVGYFEEGKLIKTVSVYQDGRYQECTYHANGQTKCSINKYPDGRSEERYYNENGEIKKIIADYPDGTHVEDEF